MTLTFRSFAAAARAAAVLAGLCLAPAAAQAPLEDPGTGKVPAPSQGFLYGTAVTLEGGRHTGFLRWGDQEAFWDDRFNSAKEDLSYLEEHLPEDRRGGKIEILGFTIRVDWDDDLSEGRQLAVRFGDLRSVEGLGENSARLTFKDGTVLEVSGGADDVRATVHVTDAGGRVTAIAWEDLARVDFQGAPPEAVPSAFRLHGRVTTRAGDFEGFIQWDSQECLSTDELDGEEDGRDVSIPMGEIRAIERRSSSSSVVERKDGRTKVLKGTNDVNDDIRGILVEDPRYGRVKISWDAFERAEFDDAGASGPGYESYVPGGPLRGTVLAKDGSSTRGRLVYDLDEDSTWEMLDGERKDVEYSIPFALVASIERLSDSLAEVSLRGGETLRLGDGNDVTEDNDGLLIVPAGGEAVYLSWEEVRRVDFEP